MADDAESLMQQALRHEQHGERDAAIKIYEEVANSDSELALYAKKSAARLHEMKEMAAQPATAFGPSSLQVVVGLLAVAICVAVAVPSLRAAILGALLDFFIYFLVFAAVAAVFKKRGTPLPAVQLIVAAAVLTAGGIYMRSVDPNAPAGGKEHLEKWMR